VQYAHPETLATAHFTIILRPLEEKYQPVLFTIHFFYINFVSVLSS